MAKSTACETKVHDCYGCEPLASDEPFDLGAILEYKEQL